MSADIDLTGWNMTSFEDAEWSPWSGAAGDARAKILGTGDGYFVAYVEAQAGYVGNPHVHESAEFFYLVDGALRNQGSPMVRGDGYVAAAGSTHTDFATDTGATYLVTFKI